MINRIKVRLFSGMLFFLILHAVNAQQNTFDQADSLFAAQLYTQAYSNYESLYRGGDYSAAMLLKMAFIQDGLGNYAEALLFLNKYYLISADRSVIPKIEELSESKDLLGYKYDDTDFFAALVSKYQLQINGLLLAVSVLLLVYVLKKREEKPVAALVLQVVFIAMILGLNNWSTNGRGVVMSSNTLLRSGPSAGAEPVEVIAKGHRVEVLKQGDVWTSILWDGKEVYVRNGTVSII